jgi:hypothetical protein
MGKRKPKIIAHTIRFPADLYEKLKASSYDSPPTPFNAEVIERLQRSIEGDEREAKLRAEIDRLQGVADKARSDFTKLLESSADISRRLDALEGKK